MAVFSKNLGQLFLSATVDAKWHLCGSFAFTHKPTHNKALTSHTIVDAYDREKFITYPVLDRLLERMWEQNYIIFITPLSATAHFFTSCEESSFKFSQAHSPAPYTIYPDWMEAQSLVRGSTSIHYLIGKRLQTVGLATKVSDTLRWLGQRRAAGPNTNMLSHLLHSVWAALNPPAPRP